jgi:hypothetical protein
VGGWTPDGLGAGRRVRLQVLADDGGVVADVAEKRLVKNRPESVFGTEAASERLENLGYAMQAGSGRQYVEMGNLGRICGK